MVSALRQRQRPVFEPGVEPQGAVMASVSLLAWLLAWRYRAVFTYGMRTTGPVTA